MDWDAFFNDDVFNVEHDAVLGSDVGLEGLYCTGDPLGLQDDAGPMPECIEGADSTSTTGGPEKSFAPAIALGDSPAGRCCVAALRSFEALDDDVQVKDTALFAQVKAVTNNDVSLVHSVINHLLPHCTAVCEDLEAGTQIRSCWVSIFMAATLPHPMNLTVLTQFLQLFAQREDVVKTCETFVERIDVGLLSLWWAGCAIEENQRLGRFRSYEFVLTPSQHKLRDMLDACGMRKDVEACQPSQIVLRCMQAILSGYAPETSYAAVAGQPLSPYSTPMPRPNAL